MATGRLAWAVLIAILVADCVAAAFVVPALEFPSREGRFSSSQLDFLKYALATDGIIALTNIPGFKEAREEGLLALGKCHRLGLLKNAQTLSLVLQDGTKRTTLAMDTDGNLAGDFGCSGLDEKLEKLQSIVDTAANMFASALDEAIVIEEQKPLFAALNNAKVFSYPNFSSVISAGEHLDHFHVYEKVEPTRPTDPLEALETHTDQGLFISIVPSISMRDGKVVTVDDGFEVELKSTGRLTRVQIPNDGASVVFMIGDGMKNWIGRNALRPIRSCPHRLVMNEVGITRVWFGRMFFPPKDAYLAKQETTFEKLRFASVEQGTKNVDFAGCSNHRHILRDLTASACGADEVFCWLACRSTTGLQCPSGQSPQCVNQDTNQIWTQDSAHCTSCSVSCYGSSPSTSNENTTTNGFCNTFAYTNMYMDGFNGVGEHIPCLIFLFQTWVLDTPVKYAFGSIGAFLIGFTVEFLILLRRETRLAKGMRSDSRVLRALPDSRSPRLHTCVLMTFYSIQLVLAYFAMLLAMSFAAIIFSMVMLGMIFGHFAFNFRLPATGNEACCNMNADEQSQLLKGAPAIVSDATGATAAAQDIHRNTCCAGHQPSPDSSNDEDVSIAGTVTKGITVDEPVVV